MTQIRPLSRRKMARIESDLTREVRKDLWGTVTGL